MSKDLLREAIADAKAVRETAIANARLALEEAFTPKLQSMLSTKIAEEMDDELEEDELEVDAIDTVEEPVADEVPADESYSEEEEEVTEEDEETEDDVYEEGEEEDLELESIIRELEADEEEVTEEDEEEEVPVSESEEMEDELEEDEEEMDLEEIIRSLSENDEEEEEVIEGEEDVEAELEEAYNTIKSLKSTINEVNLLNSKLLFSNKLFRMHSLSESQKMNVIETFDRASSVREVKLVYTTLAESLVPATTSRKRTVSEGFASKRTRSTKPARNVIVESNNFATRMQKLAGLK